MSESGTRLRDNNEKIVRLMALLKKQRDEMDFLIGRQQEEKTRIENELEKLGYKLTLLVKSLAQRLNARGNYDKTIKEIEDSYKSLVYESSKLLDDLTKEVTDLEEIMDKKTETNEDKEVIHRTSAAKDPHSVTDEENSSSDKTSNDMSPPSGNKSTSSTLPGSRKSSVRSNRSDIEEAPSSRPFKDLEEKTSIGRFDNPPPIRESMASADDIELQSYREAYSKQHTGFSSGTDSLGRKK